MYLLGFDIGSSSVKASLVDVKTGKCVITSHYPKTEAPIQSARRGWAEQNPEDWWEYIKHATHDVMHPYGTAVIFEQWLSGPSGLTKTALRVQQRAMTRDLMLHVMISPFVPKRGKGYQWICTGSP